VAVSVMPQRLRVKHGVIKIAMISIRQIATTRCGIDANR
jgi:hypothetical protein